MSSVIAIPLTRGMSAIVDSACPKEILSENWYAQKMKRCGKELFYAARRVGHGGPVLLLHRVLLGAKKEEEVDHKNGDTLDCRRENLRVATSQQNSWNQAKQKRKTYSRFKGVCRADSNKNPWRAYVGGSRDRARTIRKHLGCFPTEEAAARAYDAAAKQLFGEFARLNFP